MCILPECHQTRFHYGVKYSTVKTVIKPKLFTRLTHYVIASVSDKKMILTKNCRTLLDSVIKFRCFLMQKALQQQIRSNRGQLTVFAYFIKEKFRKK